MVDSASPPAFAPTLPAQRSEGIDFARGLALFGILLVNARFFFWPFASAIDPNCAVPGLESSTLDAVVWSIIEAFCSFKFISLFSMLFGFGIAAQANKAMRAGLSRWGFGSRRFVVLLAFGLLHATLVWYGDILVVYALFGFLVLAICVCKPRTILIWFFVLAGLLAVVSLCGGVLVYIFGTYPNFLSESIGDAEADQVGRMAAQVRTPLVEGGLDARGIEAMREVFGSGQFSFADPRWMRAEMLAYQEGPWFDLFAFRMVHWLVCLSAAIFGYGWHACALMLFGAYAFRCGLFELAARARRVRLGWTCLSLGSMAAILSVLPFWLFGLSDPLAGACHMIGLTASGLALPIGYATLLIEYAPRVPHAIRHPVASAGRMALTVYLCESILATALASWWGGALFAKLGDTALAMVSLGVWSALVILAWLWLTRFRIGPAEWLWRRLSYGRGPL